jgi:2-keto-4-pentenoate hydratase/2-oxohepta-3-ene-1,7-dioic acid hydratase in catechol pathway
MFFRKVDAIIGPDEPIVYPEHLTEELDYELELAVVLRKSESIFLRLFLVQPSTH